MSIARLMQMARAGVPAGGGDVWTDPDLANASYDSVSFSVSGQETSPQGLFFKPDGLKVYVVGFSGDDVNEYDLSTAWDISTASYLQNFSVAAQEASPNDVFFRPDGAAMYIIGSVGDDINQYSLSTPWNVSTATYVQNFSVRAQEGQPRGFFFRDDGLRLYVTGSNNDNVSEYSFGTDWDISTLSHVANFNIGASTIFTPECVFFSPNGDKFYVTDSTLARLSEFSLSTAWDISTSSFDQFIVVDSSPTGLFFKSDGSKMYVLGSSGDTIYQYSTVAPAPAAWTDPDLANASYDSVVFNVTSEAVQPIDFYIKPDGTRCFVVDITTNTVYQYSLSSAWDMTSASYDSVSFSVSSQGSTARGISFKPDGSKMFIAEASSDNVFQYSLSSSWDLSSASYDSVSYALPTVLTIASGIVFNADGSKFYIPDRGSDYLYEFDLSAAYDMSSASYNSVSINVVSVDNSPESLYFSPSGDKMFLTGSGSDAVNQYSLSSDYDLSTASYDSVSFSVSSQDGFPAGLSFKPDGSKMYILGLIGDNIYQYSTGGAAWTDPDLANASYDSVSFSVSGQATSPVGLCFSSNGENMYVSDYTGTLFQYTLSTAFDVSTASYASKSFVSGLGSNIRDCFISDDGSNFYIADQGGSDTIAQFSLSTAFDISSASTPASNTFSAAAQEGTLCAVFLKPDGTKLYVAGTAQDTVFQYSLSTAFDLSTASYDSVSLDVSAKEANLRSIYLSEDGTYLLVGGSSSDSVHGYSLSSPWDVSSASFVDSFSMASQETDLNAIWVSATGSKVFGLGLITSTIYQYSTA